MNQKKTSPDKAKEKKNGDYLKKFTETVLINAFTAFSVCFLVPMEIFIGNVNDFKFSVSKLWWILLVFGILTTGISAAIESLFPKKINRIFNLASFALGICFYIQSAFLNGSMNTIEGQTDIYEKGLVRSNLLIWAAIFAFIYVLYFVVFRLDKGWRERGRFVNVIKFISASLIVMQLTGVISLAVTTDFSFEEQKRQFLSTDDTMCVSADNNVIVFIIDSVSEKSVESALEQYPDLFDGFDGFTFYPNAISKYSRTYPSLPYLISGRDFYFDKSYHEEVWDACSEGSFIHDLNDCCDSISLYTAPIFVSGSASDYVDNCKKFEGSWFMNTNPFNLCKQAIKVSFYRCMPYAVKNKAWYDGDGVADAVYVHPLCGVEQNRSAITRDAEFHEELENIGITTSSDYSTAYRLYHLYGCHRGCFIDENGWKKESGTASYEESLHGDLTIVREYIDQMKAAGIYDNATIIITADHAFQTRLDDNLDLVEPKTCLMMAKPAGADSSEPIKMSLAPVCHGDIFATVLSAFGGDASKYGRTIYDISEDEDRIRYYYSTAIFTYNDGEIALREYEVHGDARDLDNWMLTGRNWPVKYSQNIVNTKISLTDIVGDDVTMCDRSDEIK